MIDGADDADQAPLPARLTFGEVHPGHVEVRIEPLWRPEWGEFVGLPPTAPRPSAPLLNHDATRSTLIVSPVITNLSSRFLKPKHAPITELVFENFSAPVPATEQEVRYLLQELPAGFITTYEFGLGMEKEFLPILDAIRRLPGVTCLALTRDRETGQDENVFYLTYDDYDDVRRAMHRVTERYRAEARADRKILAHNEILTALDAKRFPEAKRTYSPGTVFKLLARRSDRSPLSREDGKALVDTLSKAAPALAKDPEQLFALGETIEKVGLELLIAKFEEQLAKGGTEPQWQKLLDLNPFILSLVFGYPIVRLASQGAVGGWRLRGGAKIADYVVKNQQTHAIALVELKTPGTPLTGRDYRTGVPDISPKLTGAVMQVLDQRLKLQKSLSLIKDEEDDAEVRSAEALGIDCIVLAGRTPANRKAIKSFELFRNGLKDVRILTFDELLAKMQSLLALLTAMPEDRPPVSDDNLPF